MIKDSQKCQMCPDQSPRNFPSFIYPSGDVDQSKLPQIASPFSQKIFSLDCELENIIADIGAMVHSVYSSGLPVCIVIKNGHFVSTGRRKNSHIFLTYTREQEINQKLESFSFEKCRDKKGFSPTILFLGNFF